MDHEGWRIVTSLENSEPLHAIRALRTSEGSASDLLAKAILAPDAELHRCRGEKGVGSDGCGGEEVSKTNPCGGKGRLLCLTFRKFFSQEIAPKWQLLTHGVEGAICLHSARRLAGG